MSRQIEDYICASEDRTHYNTEDLFPRGFYLRPKIKPRIARKSFRDYDDKIPDGYYIEPALVPIATTINITNTTEVVEQVDSEQIKEVINDTLPEMKEDIANDVLDMISEDGIDEIYGGSATDVIKEPETP